MEEARRQHYLQAMGVQAWLPRTAAGGPVEEASAALDHDGGSPPAAPERAASPADARVEERAETPGTAEPLPPDEPPAWLDEAPPPSAEWMPAEGPEEPSLMVSGEDEISHLDWDALEYRVAHCELCELSRTRTNPVFGTGDRNADLMIIGEAPGAEEDKQGEPFVGRAGQLLNAMLLAIGLQREQV